VSSSAASAIGQTTAAVSGSINPNGLETTYRFEYGMTTGYGNSVPVPPASVGSSGNAVAVSQPLTGLQSNTTYHYRLVATNAKGTTASPDRSFATLPFHEAMFGLSGGVSVTSWNSVLRRPDRPQLVATGDFNGDGKDDIISAEPEPTGTTRVLYGLSNGLGLASWSVALTDTQTPTQFSAADFNNDGKTDVLMFVMT
jgi:hypothetical protein